jgi:hypothetical protein
LMPQSYRPALMPQADAPLLTAEIIGILMA